MCMCVLLVEDNEDWQFILSESVRRCGSTVTAARTLVDAQRAVSHGGEIVAIIVSADLKAGQSGSVQFVRKLRSRGFTKPIVVLVNQLRGGRELMAAGADVVWSKMTGDPKLLDDYVRRAVLLNVSNSP